jgi:hypothetical protein
MKPNSKSTGAKLYTLPTKIHTNTHRALQMSGFKRFGYYIKYFFIFRGYDRGMPLFNKTMELNDHF